MGRAFEYRAYIGYRTSGIISQCIHKDSNPVRTVSFVSHALVVALVFTHCVLNCTFDIVLRHILTLTSSDDRTQCRVIFRFRTTSLHGIAVFVDTLTDNTTRTVADVRSVFNKFGGNLGTMGSLAFLFDHKCMFTFKIKDGMDMEELILDLIDYDVEDEYEQDDEEGTITIYGDPKSYAAIQKHLEECGFEDVGGDFTYIPNDLKEVTPEQRETLDKMIERLEEFDDVQTVYTNMKPEEGEE